MKECFTAYKLVPVSNCVPQLYTMLGVYWGSSRAVYCNAWVVINYHDPMTAYSFRKKADLCFEKEDGVI